MLKDKLLDSYFFKEEKEADKQETLINGMLQRCGLGKSEREMLSALIQNYGSLKYSEGYANAEFDSNGEGC
jgi:hypothetical protein